MEQLRAVIAEIKTRLTQVDAELETIGQGLDPLDGKAATAAIMRRGKLSQEREALCLRLPVLECALADAERTIASDHLAAIAAELSEMETDAGAEVTRFAELVTQLTELVQEASARRQRHSELQSEARYI